MNSDSENSDSEQNHTMVQQHDFTQSKSKFQEMLLKFNNNLFNKRPLNVTKPAPTPEKSLFDVSNNFTPVASSTQNFNTTTNDQAFETPDVHKKKKRAHEQVKEKKRKRTVSEMVEESSSRKKSKGESSMPEGMFEKLESDSNLVQIDETPGFSKDITSTRYETFILQIPKSFDPKELVGREVSLTRKVRFKSNGVKFNCTPKACDEPATLLNNNALNTVHPKATLTIIQHVKHKNLPEVLHTFNNNINVAFPNDLKERHPLFGSDYAKNISLEKHIQHKLKAAIESNDLRKQKETTQKVDAPEEEIFKLLHQSGETKKRKKKGKDVEKSSTLDDDLISQMLFSKSMEISHGEKKKKHKKKKNSL